MYYKYKNKTSSPKIISFRAITVVPSTNIFIYTCNIIIIYNMNDTKHNANLIVYLKLANVIKRLADVSDIYSCIYMTTLTLMMVIVCACQLNICFVGKWLSA